MRKTLIILGIIPLFLCSCAVFPKKPDSFRWPNDIRSLRALCEIDIAWKQVRYDGTMSLVIEYPSRIQMEVYGPFGNTVFFLKKDSEEFLLVTQEDRITSEASFERRLGINLNEFVGDILLAASMKDNAPPVTVDRDTYKVTYRFNNKTKEIVWEGEEGTIFLSFSDISFM